MDDRSRGLLFRILPLLPAVLILSLVAAAAATSGVATGAAAGACKPTTWVDWHVAVKSQCVTRTYVCHNMTPSKLLRDPQVVDAYEDALASNDRERIAEMDVLIGQIRSAYGCGSAPDRLPGAAPRRAPGIPHGHPPIQGLPSRAGPEPGLDKTI